MDEPSKMAEGPADQGPGQIPFGFIRGVAGRVLGGATCLVLSEVDPFGVVSFTEPQGADLAERTAALARWKSGVGVLLGELAMALLPLLVSGLSGVFAHRT